MTAAMPAAAIAAAVALRLSRKGTVFAALLAAAALPAFLYMKIRKTFRDYVRDNLRDDFADIPTGEVISSDSLLQQPQSVPESATVAHVWVFLPCTFHPASKLRPRHHMVHVSAPDVA